MTGGHIHIHIIILGKILFVPSKPSALKVISFVFLFMMTTNSEKVRLSAREIISFSTPEKLREVKIKRERALIL